MFCTAVSLASIALVAHGQPAGELVEVLPLAGSVNARPGAVDHVATIVVSLTGPPRTEILTVTRSGA